MPNNYKNQDIEDIILGMADIVKENRKLRKEVEELRKIKEKYYKETGYTDMDAKQQDLRNIILRVMLPDIDDD